MKNAQETKIKDILKKVKPEGRVLDIGAGPGFLSQFVPVLSVDIDLPNLKKAKGARILADGRNLPFKDECFSTIFCIDTFHLLDNSDELMRVLKPNGKAVISAYCNKYTRIEKLKALESVFNNYKIVSKFIVGKEELDAVVVVEKHKNELRKGI
jgi:SAM-dependent methyltransferase